MLFFIQQHNWRINNQMQTFLFVLIEALVNIVQSITGFAGAPIAMPPSIALVGAADAKAAITLIFWIASIVVTVRSLREIDFKHLGIMLSFMVVGVIAGMWMFSNLPLTYLMLAYGIVVVLIGAKKLLIPSTKPLPRPLRFGALLLSGLMQGMFTSGGPFLALYSTVEIEDKRKFRATVSTVWSVLNIYMVANMYFKGMYNAYTLKLVGLSIVPVFAAIYIGNILNKKMKQATFLKLVYALLILSGSLLIFNFFNT